MALEVNSCCLCLPLKRGSKIISWLSLIFHVLLVILIPIIIVGIQKKQEFAFKDEKVPEYALTTYMTVALIVTVMQIVFDFILIFALMKRRPQLIKYWVIFVAISTSIYFIIQLYKYCISVGTDFGSSSLDLFFGILIYVIKSYFILVVFSYYRELGKGDNVQTYYE